MDEKLEPRNGTPVERVDAGKRRSLGHLVSGIAVGLTGGVGIDRGAKNLDPAKDEVPNILERLSKIISACPKNSPILQKRLGDVRGQLFTMMKRLQTLTVNADDNNLPEIERLLINEQIRLEQQRARSLEALAYMLEIHIGKSGASAPQEYTI